MFEKEKQVALLSPKQSCRYLLVVVVVVVVVVSGSLLLLVY